MARNKGDQRPREIESRKRAFAGARLMISDTRLSQQDAAKAVGSTRTSISSAMVVLQHGTAAEVAGVEGGLLPLDPTADAVRARVPQSERNAKRRPPAMTTLVVEGRKVDAEVWQKLRAGLDAITSLPSPLDTAAIVRKNNLRIEHVNRTLLIVTAWITEFENEITK